MWLRDGTTTAREAATSAAGYAGVVTDEARALADDVAHRVRGRIGARARVRERRRRRKLLLRLFLLQLLAIGALGFVVYRLLHRAAADDRPPVTHRGPDVGAPPDVPGPAFDPEGSPMGAQASGSRATYRPTPAHRPTLAGPI
jgi:hypothetical protein